MHFNSPSHVVRLTRMVTNSETCFDVNQVAEFEAIK
jgi:hypothetical protein